MAFRHGTTARFYWHTRDWSPYVESVELAMTKGVAEHRPLSGSAVARLTGQRDIRLTLAGAPFEELTTDADSEALLADTVGRPFIFLPDGDAVGGMAYAGVNIPGTKRVTAGDDIVRLPLDLLGAGTFDRGVVLHKLTSAGSSPSSSVDNLASSNTGGAAYLLCTDKSTAGALDILVEHSADELTWDTLLTMTTLTLKGSEVKEVATAVTIEQYLRVSWTLASGTATWCLAFCRR